MLKRCLLMLLLFLNLNHAVAQNREQIITASNAYKNGYFGFQVSLTEEEAIVLGSRDIYILNKDGDFWYESQHFSPVHPEFERFYLALARNDSFFVVGAEWDGGDPDGIIAYRGAVYVYKKQNASWAEHQRIAMPDSIVSILNGGSQFGTSISMNDQYMLVGEPLHLGGCVYAFELNEDNYWTLTDRLKTTCYSTGNAIALNQAKALIYGLGNDGETLLYIFENENNAWVQKKRIELPIRKISVMRFDGSLVYIGDSSDDEYGIQSGAVYVYEFNANNLNLIQKITAKEPKAYDRFGGSLDVYKDKLVIGNEMGRAYFISIFIRDGDRFYRLAEKFSSDGFGRSVGINSDFVFVGSPLDDDLGTNSGAAYFFDWLAITNIKNEPSRVNGQVCPVLLSNYPNPFNPTTTIRFDLLQTDRVTLKIYDTLGCEITTLLNQKLPPGSHEVVWNASGQSSGVYYFKLSTNTFSDFGKCLLIK